MVFTTSRNRRRTEVAGIRKATANESANRSLCGSAGGRGRVVGFFGMVFQGAAPFGSLPAGWLAGSVGVRAVVAGSGALVLLGGLVFATQLPRLRRHARPVYDRLGILPEAAVGVNAATELAPGPRA